MEKMNRWKDVNIVRKGQKYNRTQMSWPGRRLRQDAKSWPGHLGQDVPSQTSESGHPAQDIMSWLRRPGQNMMSQLRHVVLARTSWLRQLRWDVLARTLRPVSDVLARTFVSFCTSAPSYIVEHRRQSLARKQGDNTFGTIRLPICLFVICVGSPSGSHKTPWPCQCPHAYIARTVPPANSFCWNSPLDSHLEKAVRQLFRNSYETGTYLPHETAVCRWLWGRCSFFSIVRQPSGSGRQTAVFR